jgi:hypothetical protein
MCRHYSIAAAASTTIAAVGIWAYADHRVGLTELLGSVLAGEITVIAILTAIAIRYVIAENHSPKNELQHIHTHPQHAPPEEWPHRASLKVRNRDAGV